MNFVITDKSDKIEFLVDSDAFSGVKRVAGKVIDDINEITGAGVTLTEVKEAELPNVKVAVLVATCGNSAILDKLSKEGLVDVSGLTGKLESYADFIISVPGKIECLLVIAGSDKLGTIYGAFDLSEKMGVSPLKYWADACLPCKKELSVEIEKGFISREPSVRYRGLFINDEWPCYGNWTVDHFGGFTAEMYDHVFELLLRLKGNYIWPAMWSSSFAWDGPGLKSYELADEYGIFVGNSHHEPCLRAGEEYRQVRGKDSIYGDAWNFHTNTEGITRFWRDSMMERGGFNSVVTVGMRGEADSTILGADATLKDNIDLIKKVFVAQKQIIAEAEEKFNKKFPKMLALYKEVEPFYYGDENTEGLCDWDELDDVIMMLCEDNYGYTRTLPDDKMRNHPGGFGMYYHVDYHGSPISYEWINSTPLTKMWEQMSQAYDFGVRKLWILNTGDLKHNEFPLSYFMNMAYDFDKWGTSAPNNSYDYTKDFMKLHFGGALNDAEAEEAAWILTETVRLLSYRRPEALNSGIYNPVHFGEADRMLARVDELEARANAFINGKSDAVKSAWYSLTGFQTENAVNIIRMHIYAGKNALLAKQGRKTADDMASKVTETIKIDKAYKKEWAAYKDGKWAGMEMEAHVGFTKWNDDGARYPLRTTVEPFDKARMFVLRSDEEPVYDKVYGGPMTIVVDDFMYEGVTQVSLDICNTGIGTISYEIQGNLPEWLIIDKISATIENDDTVTLTCLRDKLKEDTETVVLTITDKDTRVNVKVSACKMASDVISKLPVNTVLEGPSGFVVNSVNYADKFEPSGTVFTVLDDYGVYGSAVKAYPDTRYFTEGSEPSLTYKLFAKTPGTYTLETIFAPTSPQTREVKLRFGASVNGGAANYMNTVPKGYKSGEASDPVWAEGALTHRRVLKQQIELKEGLNDVKILLPDPGLVLLRVNAYSKAPLESYFGPNETVVIK